MFLSSTLVVNLNKLNSVLIAIIVNLFQLFNDLKGVVIIFAVYLKKFFVNKKKSDEAEVVKDLNLSQQ